MSWKSLRSIMEGAAQEHINKAVANFTKRLTAYMAVALQPMVVT